MKSRFLHHIDRMAARRAGDRFEVTIVGWALRTMDRSARRVWVRFEGREYEAVRIYRPDIIPVEGGCPGDEQLPGFEIRIPDAGGIGFLEMFADDGEEVPEVLEKTEIDPRCLCDPTEDPGQRFATFRFVTGLPGKPCGRSIPKGKRALSVEWVIPDFGRGAGGHAAIFRVIRALEREGHSCRIWILHHSRHGSPERVRRVIGESFVPVEAEVRFLSVGDVGLIDGDIGFATDRWTAYYLRAAGKLAHRFYLVQDFEPSFYPAGAAYFLAEDTYRFGFSPIASSRWLAGKLAAYTEVEVPVFGYGIDHGVYRPGDSAAADRGKHRIVFYARAATSRRVVEIGVLALELLAARRTDFVVDFFGEDLSDFEAPFDSVNHGVLDAAALARLYRAGTVGVVFSATNHAILPKEMMACGLPVVELTGENLEGIYPPGTVRPTRPEPFAVARTLEELLDDSARRASQREAGLAFAAGISWDAEIAKVVRAVHARVGLPEPSADRTAG
ncbi:MAG: hypothetical protein ACLFRP_06240 [Puniceicoccaceae bacterium]